MLVGAGASCLLLGPPGFNWCFFFSFTPGFNKLLGAQGSPSSGSLLNLFSPRFLFIGVVIMIYSFVPDDSLTSYRFGNQLNVVNHYRR